MLSSNKKGNNPPSTWTLRVPTTVRDYIVKWFVEWWLLELLSWSVAAFSTSAMIAIFALYGGQPIPRWRFGFTLNGVISLLAEVAISSIRLPTYSALGQWKWIWFSSGPKPMADLELFDSASRGPWGSLFLLFRTSGK